jgi:hypothetical protein
MTMELLPGYSGVQPTDYGRFLTESRGAKGALVGARGISGTPLFGDFTFSRARMKSAAWFDGPGAENGLIVPRPRVPRAVSRYAYAHGTRRWESSEIR